MDQILLSGKKFSYTLVRKPIRSLRLRLKTSRSFIVSVPRLTPQFVVNHFIKDHELWIIKNSSKLKTHPKSNLTNLTKLTILNEDYQLIINSTSRDSVVVIPEKFQIFVNTSRPTNAHFKLLLDRKLRPLALKLINHHLRLLSEQYGFKYHRVSIRNQSSRFGSCASNGNLNFNWQIILFPLSVFQHILLHELTHLAIKNHSSKFWNQLAVYDSDWKSHRLWLKKEASKLMIFS